MENSSNSLGSLAYDYLCDIYAFAVEEVSDTQITSEARCMAAAVKEALTLAMLHLMKKVKDPLLQLGIHHAIDIAAADEAVITLTAAQAVEAVSRATRNAGPGDIVHLTQCNGLFSAFIQRSGQDESVRQIYCSPTTNSTL